jgi:hypothetical protein
MSRKKRKSDLASLAHQRLNNTRSAIVNPRLIPAKVKAVVRHYIDQRTRAIDDASDRCAIFTEQDVKRNECPAFGVGNSSYAIQPR